jgi:hypothetical protein
VVTLKDDAAAAGYPCPSWTLDDEPGPKYAIQSGSCSDEDVFSVYADASDVQQQVELGKAAEVNMLFGENWLINIPEKYRAQVQAGIGGEYVPGTEGEPTEEPTDSTWEPKKSDFELKIKTLSKKCFGSAGCNVEVRISPEYVGSGVDLPDSGTIELTYKLTGTEDPEIGTIEMELPDGTYRREETNVQTPTAGAKIGAKITDLTYSE